MQNWNGRNMFFSFPFFWRCFDSRHKISDHFLKLINITVVYKKQKFLVICTSYHVTVVLSNSDQFYLFLGLNFCCQGSKGDAILCSWAVTINCLLDIGGMLAVICNYSLFLIFLPELENICIGQVTRETHDILRATDWTLTIYLIFPELVCSSHD
jgi:hypothetical protein